MITRQQLADAYECCVDLVRPKLRACGINHMKRLTLEEFREYIKVNGWPMNKDYQYLADLAMKSPIQARLF